LEQKQLKLESQKLLLNNEKSNDIFMEWDVLLLKNDVNLNGYYFTEGFIDEIVDNQDKYIGIPITVDMSKLQDKNFLELGHNYSHINNKFYTDQIGSYVGFEKVYDETGIAQLIGHARVSKRNTDLVSLLMELYNSESGINLSVEVLAQEYHVNENNWLVIDKNPTNYLIADCIVSFPAEPNSKVLKLVSEILSKENNILDSQVVINSNKEGGKLNMENNLDVNKVIEDNTTLTLENEQMKSQLEELKTQVETLTSEKSTLEVSLNESNETVVSLGKEKESLVAQVTELSTFKSEVIEKENTAKIDAIISEVKSELTEEEMTLVAEVAEGKDPEKVQFKVNELCAKKYKESLKLVNSKTEEVSFFALSNQKDLGSDELSKFNM
jgi:hypothetical protein